MAKREKRLGTEAEIARAMLQVMPNLPKVLKHIFGRIERFDFREPTTFIAEMKAQVQSCAPKLDGPGQENFLRLWGLLEELPLKQEAKRRMNEIIGMTKREAAKDERYSLLLKLMSAADAKVPLASIIVALRHADPEEALGPQCAPHDLLEQAERERGEVRATAVLRALGETAEALYKPYLVTIWSLSFLKDGQPPPPQIPAFGNLVKDTHRRLPDYPGLVEPDAGWMRNCAIHNPRKYLIGEDALEMWDRNVARRAVRVDDMHAMAKRMYLISGVTIHRVGQLYMFRNFLVNTGLFDALVELLPHVFMMDDQRALAAEQKLMAKAHDVTRPLEEFFNPHTPPAGG